MAQPDAEPLGQIRRGRARRPRDTPDADTPFAEWKPATTHPPALDPGRRPSTRDRARLAAGMRPINGAPGRRWGTAPTNPRPG